ncbi:MAG TPA: PilZ domain-containing protein [Candidatus Methylomirabilis sp.]|nr:PilZ domain-containing protein [Candidatus Methylomirabilis sp.]
MPRKPGASSKTRVASHRAAVPDGRRYARFAVRLPVRCRRLTARTTRTWSGRTADVGSGGFSVELPTRLPPGTPLVVEIRTGIGPLRMEVEVRWTRCILGRVGIIRHGLCLADRSEILELPIGTLLGEWLQGVAKREGKRGGRAHAPAHSQRRSKAR